MTFLVDDHCGGGLFLWITAVATAVIVTTGAVDDNCGDGCRGEWCRGDANVVMVVAIDDCRSKDRRVG